MIADHRRPAPAGPSYVEASPGADLFEKPAYRCINDLVRSRLGVPRVVTGIDGVEAGAVAWPAIPAATERRALLDGAAILDRSAMTYLRFSGPQASALLDFMTPRDLRSLRVGEARFAVFTTRDGTVDDEGLVLCLGGGEYLVSFGGCRSPAGLNVALSRFPNVEVRPARVIAFDLKGPRQLEAMASLLDADAQRRVLELTPFCFVEGRATNGAPVRIVKTKVGTELWADPETIGAAWAHMLARPGTFTPTGWRALHAYRMDCDKTFFSLYPLDLNAQTCIRTVRHGWMVQEARHDFIGRDALMRAAAPACRLGRLVRTSDGDPAPAGALLFDGHGGPAGVVTSSTRALRSGRSTAFALIRTGPRASPRIRTEDGHEWSVVEA